MLSVGSAKSYTIYWTSNQALLIKKNPRTLTLYYRVATVLSDQSVDQQQNQQVDQNGEAVRITLGKSSPKPRKMEGRKGLETTSYLRLIRQAVIESRKGRGRSFIRGEEESWGARKVANRTTLKPVVF